MQENLLTRRDAIKRMAAILGVSLTSAQVGLLAEANATSQTVAPRFFDEEQFAMLTRIADLIIPETETPGAVGVGAHAFIDMMLAQWASDERKANWIEGLSDIERRAQAAGLESFNTGTEAEQVKLLTALDHEYFERGYEDTFFSGLKKMVLFAYYSTEQGATVELRYLPVPGDYLSCIPLEDVGRAWFWNGYSYGL